MTQNYLWTDNPTEANVAVYDSDILNECLMHLKYQNIKTTPFCVNSASTDTAGAANLLSYQSNTVKFNCGNSVVPIMTANLQNNWTLSSSHPINTSTNDIYKSFDNNNLSYCSLQHTPTEESPAYLSVAYTSSFSFDYLYLYFNETLTPGTMKNFYILDADENIIYSYENYEGILKQNTFLIPLQGFVGNKITISTKSNINNTNYVNFPNVIKLLKKDQVISFTNSKGINYLLGALSDLSITQVSSSGTEIQNIYIKNDGQAEALVTPLNYSNTLPSSPVLNQVHYLTNTEPAQAKIYDGTSWKDCDNKTPLGKVTLSNGSIISVSTNPYNQNSYNINSNTPASKAGNLLTKDQFTQLLSSPGWTKLPNGLILQWGVVSGYVTYPVTFPNAGFPFLTTKTGSGPIIASIYGAPSLAGFSVTLSAASDCYWMAIGY